MEVAFFELIEASKSRNQLPYPQHFSRFLYRRLAASSSVGPCAATECARTMDCCTAPMLDQAASATVMMSCIAKGKSPVSLPFLRRADLASRLHSVRPIARHFFSESLPFADSPIKDWESHGHNICESAWSGSHGTRRYNQDRDGLRCNGRRKKTDEWCRKWIRLGTRLTKGRDNPEKRCLITKILMLIRLGFSSTHANGSTSPLIRFTTTSGALVPRSATIMPIATRFC